MTAAITRPITGISPTHAVIRPKMSSRLIVTVGRRRDRHQGRRPVRSPADSTETWVVTALMMPFGPNHWSTVMKWPISTNRWFLTSSNSPEVKAAPARVGDYLTSCDSLIVPLFGGVLPGSRSTMNVYAAE